MKIFQQCIAYSLVMVTVALCTLSCEDEYMTDANEASIPISVTGENIKAPGKNQYRVQRKLIDDSVVFHIDLSSFGSINSFTVSKTINLESDNDFGTSGTLTIDPGSISGAMYDLTYYLEERDLEQLVGLTFRIETTAGQIYISDVTVVVTLTPRGNIPLKRWLLTAQIWVDNDNFDDLADCEKDDSFLFNADSTLSIDYGTNTGVAPCDLDNLTVYEQWYLTADEKFFIIKRSGVFDPTVAIDSFRVKSLTIEKMELEIDFDLSVFGYSEDETFLYEYTAQPK